MYESHLFLYIEEFVEPEEGRFLSASPLQQEVTCCPMINEVAQKTTLKGSVKRTTG